MNSLFSSSTLERYCWRFWWCWGLGSYFIWKLCDTLTPDVWTTCGRRLQVLPQWVQNNHLNWRPCKSPTNELIQISTQNALAKMVDKNGGLVSRVGKLANNVRLIAEKFFARRIFYGMVTWVLSGLAIACLHSSYFPGKQGYHLCASAKSVPAQKYLRPADELFGNNNGRDFHPEGAPSVQ